MKLHVHPFSQHSRRVLMLCHELGIDPEIVPVSLEKGEHRSEAFLRLNPNGQVPVLVTEDLVLSESHAIMKFLASANRGMAFYPAGLKERATVDMWLDWNHTRLNPPVQAATIQVLFMGEKADKELIAKSRDQAREAIRVLEMSLPSKAGIGGSPTLADVSIASTLALFELSGGDLSEFPRCAGWYAEMKARPSFQKTAPMHG
jgi:glutathione S-transferase